MMPCGVSVRHVCLFLEAANCMLSFFLGVAVEFCLCLCWGSLRLSSCVHCVTIGDKLVYLCV